MRFDNFTSEALHENLDQMQKDLAELHQAISRQYFYLHHQSAIPEQTQTQ